MKLLFRRKNVEPEDREDCENVDSDRDKAEMEARERSIARRLDALASIADIVQSRKQA